MLVSPGRVDNMILYILYSLNQSSRKIGKNLLFTVNANIFSLVYKRLKTDARKFDFCRLPFAVNVMLKLSIALGKRKLKVPK